MPDRSMPMTGKVTDPSMQRAFMEGVGQGMSEIYSGNLPEWDVVVEFDGTPIRKLRIADVADVLVEIRTALADGCKITVSPVTNENRREIESVTASNDDEVVDAEIVD